MDSSNIKLWKSLPVYNGLNTAMGDYGLRVSFAAPAILRASNTCCSTVTRLWESVAVHPHLQNTLKSVVQVTWIVVNVHLQFHRKSPYQNLCFLHRNLIKALHIKCFCVQNWNMQQRFGIVKPKLTSLSQRKYG